MTDVTPPPLSDELNEFALISAAAIIGVGLAFREIARDPAARQRLLADYEDTIVRLATDSPVGKSARVQQMVDLLRTAIQEGATHGRS